MRHNEVLIKHRRTVRPSRWMRAIHSYTVEDAEVVYNIRTNAGTDFVCDSCSNAGSRPAVAQYIALSTDATTPAVTDTTLTSELATNGLARAVATYAHTASQPFYTLTKAFTYSGGSPQANVQKEAVFTASSSGILVAESTFAAKTLQPTDVLTIVHTINV